MKKTKVTTAGGGFSGLYAAMHFDKRLARRADVEVTLISRENFILFTPMLHEVAAGDLHPGDIVNPIHPTITRNFFARAGRIRARAMQQTSIMAISPPVAAIRDQS
jgi:NADH dehydrogenase FAD-containing subunit